MRIPKRLVIPPSALAEWREKYPCLPAFEPVYVGDPYEVYVHESAILSDPRVKAAIKALERIVYGNPTCESAMHALDYSVSNARAALAALQEAKDA